MKNWLKVLFAVILVLTCMFAYVACDNNTGDNTGDNTGGNNPTTEPGDTTKDTYKINFIYGYSAVTINNYGRIQYTNHYETVATKYVPRKDAKWEDLISEIEAITYNGYKFAEWYPEWNRTTKTGWEKDGKPQRPVGDPFAFEGSITKNINLYAYRGYVAGEDIVWDIVYENQNKELSSAKPATGEAKVSFVNVSKENNIITKTTLSSMIVDKTTGWTSQLVATKNNINYNGYRFTSWYTEWDYETMSPKEGSEYDFSTAPTNDTVLYGVLSDTRFSTTETQLTKVSATLNLKGSGEMFDFAYRTQRDIPWFTYKDDITHIVMDDDITCIGNNAFAGLTALKDVHFSEAITSVGDYAFYECGKNFTTLRLPSKVKTIGEGAFASTFLSQVVLNDGLETIKDKAFHSTYKISWIIVPDTLKFIGQGAFYAGANDHMLSKVYYYGSHEDFNKIDVKTDNDCFTKIPTIYSYHEKTDSSTYIEGLYWYAVNRKGQLYPAQYNFAVKYMIMNLKTPIAIDYVQASPKVDANGEIELDSYGNPKLEGIFSEKNIKFREELQYNGYNFFEFFGEIKEDKTGKLYFNGNPLKLGDKITADKSQACARTIEGATIQGTLGGGITWSLDIDGVLTVSPSSNEGDSNRMWDTTYPGDASAHWYGAFEDAVKIKKIIIEPGVKYIGKYAFAGTGISEIIIPTSVEEIHPDAFYNCVSLVSVYYEGDKLFISTTDGNGNEVQQEACKGLTTLRAASARVFAKATEATAEDGSYWMELENNKKIAWRLNNGNLYVGGDIKMIDFALPSDAPWYAAKDSITSVSIAPNIISIGENMVSGYTGITSISLNAVVKQIPESSFENTGIINNLSAYKEGLLIVNKVLLKVDPTRRNSEFFVTNTDIRVIANGAFSRCAKLKGRFISNTVQYINADAFDDSEIERIFVSGSAETWKSTAADFNWSKIQVFYSSDSDTKNNDSDGFDDFDIISGVYTPTKCNHIYGAWEIITHPTCQTDGERTHSCIFGDDCIIDDKSVETETIPAGTAYHVWGEYVDNGDGTATATCTTCPEDKKATTTKPIQ